MLMTFLFLVNCLNWKLTRSKVIIILYKLTFDSTSDCMLLQIMLYLAAFYLLAVTPEPLDQGDFAKLPEQSLQPHGSVFLRIYTYKYGLRKLIKFIGKYNYS